jgi:hypothetical protein
MISRRIAAFSASRAFLSASFAAATLFVKPYSAKRRSANASVAVWSSCTRSR